MSLIYRCCCKPKDDYAIFFCVLPLSLSALIICTLLLWWSAWEMYSSITYIGFPNFGSVLSLIIGCFRALCGLLGILGVLIKKGGLMRWMTFLVDFLVGLAVFTFIYQWIVWGLALGGVTTRDNIPWEPTGWEITNMVIISLSNILLVIVGYTIIGMFKSLEKVFENGGNGWERLNYKELGGDDIEDAAASNYGKYGYDGDDEVMPDKRAMGDSSMMDSEMDSQMSSRV